MILIVDSGATKSDWIALDEKGNQVVHDPNFRIKSRSIDPSCNSKTVWPIILKLSKNRENVTQLFFYGPVWWYR